MNYEVIDFNNEEQLFDLLFYYSFPEDGLLISGTAYAEDILKHITALEKRIGPDQLKRLSEFVNNQPDAFKKRQLEYNLNRVNNILAERKKNLKTDHDS